MEDLYTLYHVKNEIFGRYLVIREFYKIIVVMNSEIKIYEILCFHDLITQRLRIWSLDSLSIKISFQSLSVAFIYIFQTFSKLR